VSSAERRGSGAARQRRQRRQQQRPASPARPISLSRARTHTSAAPWTRTTACSRPGRACRCSSCRCAAPRPRAPSRGSPRSPGSAPSRQTRAARNAQRDGRLDGGEAPRRGGR
jgi:hypothetical protein